MSHSCCPDQPLPGKVFQEDPRWGLRHAWGCDRVVLSQRGGTMDNIVIGSRVSVPGGRIGKVVDIEPHAYYPVFVRFEFDGYAYEESDMKLVEE